MSPRSASEAKTKEKMSPRSASEAKTKDKMSPRSVSQSRTKSKGSVRATREPSTQERAIANQAANLAKAEARYIHVSPQKARLVIDLIRGQQAGDAINILSVTNKRIASVVEKVLRSAIANAENKSQDVDVDKLFVSEAYVNEGPRVKRIRPAPMGRAFRYQRRMAHIVVKVAEQEVAEAEE